MIARLLATASAAALFVLPAMAETTALLIANEDYDSVSDVRRGDEPADAVRALETAGAQVFASEEVEGAELRQALTRFSARALESDRLLVVLSGRFVHSMTETYFLPTDIRPQPLASLSTTALPLSTVMAYLAEAPGSAVLVLATDETSGDFGPLLQIGLGALQIPQGVTVVSGEPRPAARFVNRTLASAGADILEGARRNQLTVAGYAPRDRAFLEEVAETEPDRAPVEDSAARIRQDIQAWRRADSIGTADAYRDYIDANPQGQFVRMAENRIAALEDTPEARAERAEQALDLNREQRREIQRALTLLGFNTRGIDGIFGRGTRGAITSWQRDSGFPETGFFDREQLIRLDAQAERRAAELQAEAERRQAEELAADRAFWEETGALGDEAGFRAYLNRYPDGEYAEIARDELEDIERAKRRQADAVDRQLWNEARMENTLQAYRDYLELRPNGAFREEAEAQIARLEEERSDQRQAAIAAENALNLSPSARRSIEQRLAALELRPGQIDGVFDRDTRRAIRRYQNARNLPRTGYLNERVVVLLLADSVRSIFR